jgi:hypothetical protein
MKGPAVPACCSYVCESGGRIFLPDPDMPTAAPMSEDLDWRRQHEAVAGPLHQDALPPAQRAGALWEFFAELQREGWSLDAVSYTTAFRCVCGHACMLALAVGLKLLEVAV